VQVALLKSASCTFKVQVALLQKYRYTATCMF
jgi:hypothetical protein